MSTPDGQDARGGRQSKQSFDSDPRTKLKHNQQCEYVLNNEGRHPERCNFHTCPWDQEHITAHHHFWRVVLRTEPFSLANGHAGNGGNGGEVAVCRATWNFLADMMTREGNDSLKSGISALHHTLGSFLGPDGLREYSLLLLAVRNLAQAVAKEAVIAVLIADPSFLQVCTNRSLWLFPNTTASSDQRKLKTLNKLLPERDYPWATSSPRKHMKWSQQWFCELLGRAGPEVKQQLQAHWRVALAKNDDVQHAVSLLNYIQALELVHAPCSITSALTLLRVLGNKSRAAGESNGQIAAVAQAGLISLLAQHEAAMQSGPCRAQHWLDNHWNDSTAQEVLDRLSVDHLHGPPSATHLQFSSHAASSDLDRSSYSGSQLQAAVTRDLGQMVVQDLVADVASLQPAPASGDASTPGAQQRMQYAFPPTMQMIDRVDLELEMASLGQGGYGQVLRAKWLGKPVAVKWLHDLGHDQYRSAEAFRQEIITLGACNHPSIARFIAVCYEPPSVDDEEEEVHKSPILVMEQYSAGSLSQLLQRAHSRLKGEAALKELTWRKRLGQLHDVAAGMHYLHTRNPAVIHGDLRCDNLLLEYKRTSQEQPRYHVCIADFGLAKMLDPNDSRCSASRVTHHCWLAPEVLERNEVSKESDVYSYGMCMWEVLTGRTPFQGLNPWEVMLRRKQNPSETPVLSGPEEVLGSPGQTLDAYMQLMQRCWALERKSRPDFLTIMQELQRMIEEEQRLAEGAAAGKTALCSGAAGGGGCVHLAPLAAPLTTQQLRV